MNAPNFDLDVLQFRHDNKKKDLFLPPEIGRGLSGLEKVAVAVVFRNIIHL